jgi:DNA-binding beta-propeller fold protein YncE/predicted Ser/Thr protein kinase
MAELAPGTVFAGHRIEALAGRGGMGVVYRATHLALERTVALKVVSPELVEDASTRRRFLRESKVAASIDHPNVIPVYYTGEEDGTAYIAMRYVPGEDLRTLVRTGGPLEPRRAARIVAQIGAALDAAHAAGLVHRDVKPGNVLLGPSDHVYLSDFGLSKSALSLGGETRSGHWVGSLDYVAPEQIRGERLDARADVYALGCVLYSALTGCPPYERDGDEAKLWAHLTEPPPVPSRRVPGLPSGMDAVVARALAKRPDNRYPSAGDLGRAAVAAAEEQPVREGERVVAVGAAAPDETPTESADRPAAAPVAEPAGRGRRPRWILPVAAGVALAAAATAVIAFTSGGGSGPPANLAATPPPQPKVVAAVRVTPRPNGIAVGKRLVFVTAAGRRRVALIDERTAKRRDFAPTVGRGAADVTTGLGAAWVTAGREHALYKLDAATGRKLGRFALPDAPKSVAAGPLGLWVGMLTELPGAPDTLARLDPRTGRLLDSYPVPEGAGPLVATPTALWVVNRLAPAVSRFNPALGRFDKRVKFGDNRLGKAAFGAGAVWVTSPLEDTVVRIDDRTGAKVSSGVGRRPTGIAARGGNIWVTSYIDHTIIRLDARTGEPTGKPVRVPLNPYTLAVTSDSVWVTAVGSGQVARVRNVASPR